MLGHSCSDPLEGSASVPLLHSPSGLCPVWLDQTEPLPLGIWVWKQEIPALFPPGELG